MSNILYIYILFDVVLLCCISESDIKAVSLSFGLWPSHDTHFKPSSPCPLTFLTWPWSDWCQKIWAKFRNSSMVQTPSKLYVFYLSASETTSVCHPKMEASVTKYWCQTRKFTQMVCLYLCVRVCMYVLFKANYWSSLCLETLWRIHLSVNMFLCIGHNPEWHCFYKAEELQVLVATT